MPGNSQPEFLKLNPQSLLLNPDQCTSFDPPEADSIFIIRYSLLYKPLNPEPLNPEPLNL
jgi:hypothetical protein